MDLLLHNLRTIGTHHCDGTVGEEAAQEIERLRGENAVLLGLLGDAAGVIRSIDPEDDNEPPNLREIWAAADKKEKDWREAGEEKLLQQMLDAREGLKSLGWRDGQYAPKDGTRFLSIEAGSTGVFPCYWMTNKHMAEGGGFWSEAHGDLWPAKPTLWKPMPSNAEITGGDSRPVD